MTSDLSTAALNLEEQCFPNSAGKVEFRPHQTIKLGRSRKTCLPCPLSQELLEDVLPERERKQIEKETDRGRCGV